MGLPLQPGGVPVAPGFWRTPDSSDEEQLRASLTPLLRAAGRLGPAPMTRRDREKLSVEVGRYAGLPLVEALAQIEDRWNRR